jgi:hypothetical protein
MAEAEAGNGNVENDENYESYENYEHENGDCTSDRTEKLLRTVQVLFL